MPSVFVTSGATVPFPDLIRNALSKEFVAALAAQGYDRLVVQYGRSEEGRALYDDAVAKLGASPAVRIEGIAFTSDINSYISAADLVVSHAGTGSILDTLRLQKKLIVVVNNQLMDNHQQEVAREMETQGHLVKVNTSLEELLAAVQEVATHEYTPLPPPSKGVIQQILQEL